MKLSIIIPVYNEERFIDECIAAVYAAPLPENMDREIIVVDDASSDATPSKIKKLHAKGLVNIAIFHDKNQGKGAALRSGFSQATGEITIVQDADLEYDPAEFPRMVQPILDQKADVVFGSRFIGGECHRVLYFWHSVGNKILTLLSNMVTNLNLTDMEVCYKAIRTDILRKIKLEENRFGFEPEITAKVAKLDARIYEVGISYCGRTYKEGKKIGIKDGLRAIYCILKYGLFR